jgi:hypothetical protein
MTEVELERGRVIKQAAINEAIDWLLMAEARGVTPITTITAAALLIGQIAGSSADNEANLQAGLDHIFSMARLTAKDFKAR